MKLILHAAISIPPSINSYIKNRYTTIPREYKDEIFNFFNSYERSDFDSKQRLLPRTIYYIDHATIEAIRGAKWNKKKNLRYYYEIHAQTVRNSMRQGDGDNNWKLLQDTLQDWIGFNDMYVFSHSNITTIIKDVEPHINVAVLQRLDPPNEDFNAKYFALQEEQRSITQPYYRNGEKIVNNIHVIKADKQVG